LFPRFVPALLSIASLVVLLGAGDEADARAHKHRPGCPSGMVRVHDYCIDRYEAPNRAGAKPLVMQSANDAHGWCESHGKRLCTEDEWIGACQGDDHAAYPYGNQHVDGRCNDDRAWLVVKEATLAKWPADEAQEHAKELYHATPSGSKHECVTEDGVYDMTGNVEEWVVRTHEHANDWPYILAGCYWSGCYGGGKPTCHSTNSAHGPAFRFYETGFRCCKDVPFAERSKGSSASTQ
jgi:formylglycine-generating enzyme required for sulfatase activity